MKISFVIQDEFCPITARDLETIDRFSKKMPLQGKEALAKLIAEYQNVRDFISAMIEAEKKTDGKKFWVELSDLGQVGAYMTSDEADAVVNWLTTSFEPI